MKRKIFALFLAIAIIVCTFSCTVSVSAAKNDVLSYEITDENTVAITECKKNAISVKIPEKIEGYPVTSIQNYAFENCSKLKEIELPDTLTEIQCYAFSDCVSLRKIEIPESVEYIWENAFSGCVNLSEIEVDDKNEMYTDADSNCIIEKESASLILGCKNTVIPDDGEIVTSIQSFAFESCKGLTKIVIPENITYIQPGVFAGCENVESVECENNQSYFCDGTSIVGIQNGELIFLVSGAEIPENVKIISEYTFCGNGKLESITIPQGVEEIGWSAFFECENLKSISVPDSVKSIGIYAFSECPKLKDISIPDCAVEIGSCAFDGTAFGNNEDNYENGALYCGNHLISVESCESFEIREKTVTVASGAFGNCGEIREVKFPDSLKLIGSSAFSGCAELESVNIPEGVTVIGDYAFDNCDSLKSFTAPNSIERIGTSALAYCENLENVVFPDKIFAIGSTIVDGTVYFNNENNWENGILYIGNHAVMAKEDLSNAVIREGTITIAESLFLWCNNIKKLTVPNSVQYIGSFAMMLETENIYYSGSNDELSKITVEDGNYGFTQYAKCSDGEKKEGENSNVILVNEEKREDNAELWFILGIAAASVLIIVAVIIVIIKSKSKPNTEK